MGSSRAIYEGTLVTKGTSTYAKECLRFLGVGDGVVNVRLRICYQVADDFAAEQISYILDGKPLLSYFRDADATGWYQPRDKRLTFTEKNQFLAPNALGFLIPPPNSRLFAELTTDSFPNGDPCVVDSATCNTILVPYYSYSARTNAQFNRDQGLISAIMMKQPQAIWKLGAKRAGYPVSMHFEEYAVDVNRLGHPPVSRPTPVAVGTYRLIKVEHADKAFDPRYEIPEDTQVTVERNHVSTSSNLSPKQRGQWREYARNEAVWKEIEREQDVSWAPIGAGILLFFGGALLLRYWLIKRKKAA
jgi:hypothetical protein